MVLRRKKITLASMGEAIARRVVNEPIYWFRVLISNSETLSEIDFSSLVWLSFIEFWSRSMSKLVAADSTRTSTAFRRSRSGLTVFPTMVSIWL